MKYISLLRGINVSGKNSIKMDALKKVFETLKSKNVSTYIQSGNVVFEHNETDLKALEKKIAARILSDFGLEVPVLVLTGQKLKQVVDDNPFANDKPKDISFLHVTFLSERPADNKTESIQDSKTEFEEIAFGDNAIYLYCPNGYGRTKLNNNFLENKLKVQATTRNWKTTLKLLEMVDG